MSSGTESGGTLTSCLRLVCLVIWHRLRRRHFNLLFEVSVSCHLEQNEEEALNLLFEVSVSCHLEQNEEEALKLLFEVSVSCHLAQNEEEAL